MNKKRGAIILLFGLLILSFAIYSGHSHRFDFMQIMISEKTRTKMWEVIGYISSFPIGFSINLLIENNSIDLVVYSMLGVITFVFLNGFFIS